jgi:hypothetical protein
MIDTSCGEALNHIQCGLARSDETSALGELGVELEYLRVTVFDTGNATPGTKWHKSGVAHEAVTHDANVLAQQNE